MIQKPSKLAELTASYRSISLLPVLSQLFEKLLLPKLLEIIERQKIIPNHPFGFRPRHATTGQIHRIVKKINTDMDTGRYGTAAFLDVTQTFDKVCHAGLLHKIKSCFPPDLYAIIKSYLLQRIFRVKFEEVVTQLRDINSGVPQGSVLGTVLYLQYIRRFSSCSGYHYRNSCRRCSYPGGSQRPYKSIPAFARKPLPHSDIAKKWRIRVNGAKSVQMTFTRRRKTYPPVILIGVRILQAENAKYLGLHFDQTKLEKTHIHQAKTWNSTEPDILDAREQVAAVNRK